jgi:hypothetical protein
MCLTGGDMARLKVLFLYFVVPILTFSGFVLYEVGVKHFETTMMIVGAIVFVIFAWIRRTPKERRAALAADESAYQQAQDDWSTYYSIREIDRHRE